MSQMDCIQFLTVTFSKTISHYTHMHISVQLVTYDMLLSPVQVSQVILEMGLKDVADSRIGSSIIRGISGGEQRRVTIAIQLLKDPGMSAKERSCLPLVVIIAPFIQQWSSRLHA